MVDTWWCYGRFREAQSTDLDDVMVDFGKTTDLDDVMVDFGKPTTDLGCYGRFRWYWSCKVDLDDVMVDFGMPT